ncbi:TPA: helix-turn-helix transcriptional regulator [Streptococcus suis]|uniref:helix-turn-helix domain-containing protein n=1 Tax=Streptococcus suis TaxID=1307 RepID=UPI001558E1A7|nr:helix-turn-helix transcriptional regulator [Streptococcus suis]NQL54665.1 helix-turn-helix transcriptional regulator [Streptococcus suis]QZT29384.1 helix-turn-helix domain-containing protein [Streptococcus suis]HEM4066989.1 helix-turn-helix transcriptional regulator [Streptococcus suis]HEM4642226.1 helix-turn-helix transcriptional regulator [Streptococcus suis]HEM5171899.1 helix-turn-helix transcriptional regulator [Streptococcus suis]
MKQLAQQIKNLRTTKNLSQDELAEKLYISRQAVSKWENGEATPDIDKLVQLAEIFGVSLDYLVLGKEPEKEIVVEQRGKMNVWEYLNEESKRQLTRGDFIFLILCLVMFIQHYF